MEQTKHTEHTKNKTELIDSSLLPGVFAVHVRQFVQPQEFMREPHSHSHCELFIHLKGDMEIFVEKNFYKISDRSVRLYASGELHFGRIAKAAEMEWFQLSLPRALFWEPLFAPLGKIFFEKTPGEQNVFLPKDHEKLVLLMQEIFEARQQENPFFDSLFVGNLVKILYLINQKISISESRAHQSSPALTFLIQTINENTREISKLADLCERTHYSQAYISELFSKKMGISPYQFIISKKLNLAKAALADGATVSQACEAAGFNNYSNFITLFGKTFGMTPNCYRQSAPHTEHERLIDI